MRYRSGTILNVALIAAALGFGLISGPVGVVAKVLAVIFFVRFVRSLRGTPPTIWTVNHELPGQFFSHHHSTDFHPHDES